MIERPLLLSLNVAFIAVALSASPPQEGQKAIASDDISQSAGQTTPASGREEARKPSLQRRNPRYRLCKGDVLDLHFPFTPDFNQTVTVQPDGHVTLHGLGDLPVEGKTVPELTETLRVAYSKDLHDPTLTVDLKDFEKPYFIVTGEVGHPGKFDLRGDTTVTQAVAVAGGLSASAKHSQVLLFRGVSDNWVEVKTLDLKRMLQAKNLAEDVHLQPGDLVFVPKNTFSKISSFIPRPSVGVYLNPWGW